MQLDEEEEWWKNRGKRIEMLGEHPDLAVAGKVTEYVRKYYYNL